MSFEPQVISKQTQDVGRIEDKVLSMYTSGMGRHDIANTVEDITISTITDRVVERAAGL